MDSLQRLSQSISQAISLVATLRRENEELLAELRRVSQEKESAGLQDKVKELEGKLKAAEEHITQYAQDLARTREKAVQEGAVMAAEIETLKLVAVPAVETPAALEEAGESKHLRKMVDQLKKERVYVRQKLEEIHGDLESLRLV